MPVNSRRCEGLALGACLLLAGCDSGGPSPSPSPSESARPAVVYPFAVALDPASPLSSAQVGEAVEAGFRRWEADNTAYTPLGQGVSAEPVLEDDGLQVVWLWWGSEAWPYDEGAWLVERTWDRQGQTGFDLVVRGPVCPGAAEGDGARRALANAVAAGIGRSLGIIPLTDPESPLAGAACVTSEDLTPTTAERQAMAGLYPR